HFRVHDSGGGGDGGIERGGHAVPADARGGHAEDSGGHAAAHRLDLLGGIPGVGNGGRIDGQPAGWGLRGAGAETASTNRFPSGLADAGSGGGGRGVGGDGGRMGSEFPRSGQEAAGDSARRIGGANVGGRGRPGGRLARPVYPRGKEEPGKQFFFAHAWRLGVKYLS